MSNNKKHRHLPRAMFREASGKMFKSVDYTFTAYQGCGTADEPYPCPYGWCKAQNINHRPVLKLTDPTKMVPAGIREAVIFVNSAHDVFAPVIPNKWIQDLCYWMARQDPSLMFYLQSKYITRGLQFREELKLLKDRVILGTTMETNDQQLLNGIGCKGPAVQARSQALEAFRDSGFRTRVSLEPLFKFKAADLFRLVMSTEPELVELGLDNYKWKHGLDIPQPDPDEYRILVKGLFRRGVEIYEKQSIRRWKQ